MDDLPVLRALSLRAVAADPQAFDSSYDEMAGIPDEFWASLVADPSQAFMAEADGSHVALVSADWADVADLGERWIAVRNLWVDPSHRRHGVGRALLDRVEIWGRAVGAVKAVLVVQPSQTAAIALYRASGYQVEDPAGVAMSKRLPASGQTSLFAATVLAARSRITAAADDPWISALQGARWIGVLDETTWLLSEPVAGYAFDHAHQTWTGPPGISGPAANTDVEFAGGRWAMVTLPLPDEPDTATRLLVHEAWHAFGQPRFLPHITSGELPVPGKELLDRADGRTWLRLHLNALAAALRSIGADRDRHAANALAFRWRMLAYATDEERERQRCLELAEGIAEYISWRAIGASPAAVADYIDGFDVAGIAVRSFAYRTGAGLGTLLDQARPDWHSLSIAQESLSGILAGSLTIPVADEQFAADYGYDRIRPAEDERERAQLERLAHCRRRYVGGPVLRIPLSGGRFTFEPNGTTPVPEGTFYAPFRWSGPEGARVEASGGALLLSDWSAFDLPLDRLCLEPGRGLEASGDGWHVTLPGSWRVERSDRGLRAVAPEN